MSKAKHLIEKIKRALIILIVGEMIMAILKALGVGEVSY